MGEKKTLDSSLLDFLKQRQTPQDFFINEDIVKAVDIELKGFEFFFTLARLDERTKKELRVILSEARRLPAALGGFHGDYPGGLFDHILLVVNYANFLCSSLKDKSWLQKVLLIAICHDFGKIQHYGFKLNLKDRRIKIHVSEAETVRSELIVRFGLSGKDRHVENGIAVIKKYLTIYDLLFDEEMHLALVFHHGSWSKYQPQRMNAMASLIHVADMVASQILKI